MQIQTLKTEDRGLVDVTMNVLSAYPGMDYYAYEREGTWFVGIGNLETLQLDPSGHHTTRVKSDGSRVDMDGEFEPHARAFCAEHQRQGHLVFGFLTFNYALFTRQMPFNVSEWPLASLSVPRIEIRVHPGQISISHATEDDMRIIRKALSISNKPHPPRSLQADMYYGKEEYKGLVSRGLASISHGDVQKVILSRKIPLPHPVDLLGALRLGQSRVTPKRTFSIRQCGIQATGFSPEMVLSLRKGVLQTEPLAGTRSCSGTSEENMRLREELLTDGKEIVEHVLSVKEAMEELNQLCIPASIAVKGFMTVKVRGPVQHLGSTVEGVLSPEKDIWDAFRVLFPSVTASGIPKSQALPVIDQLEDAPRELYSGAVMMLESQGSGEACLVLRTIFQDQKRAWTQVGAGILGASTPEREFTETCEKAQTVLQ